MNIDSSIVLNQFHTFCKLPTDLLGFHIFLTADFQYISCDLTQPCGWQQLHAGPKLGEMGKGGESNGKLLHYLMPKYFMNQNQTLSNMVLEGGTPGPESTSQATREEQGRISNISDNYDADRTNPSGSRSADAAPCERNRLHFTKTHNIGTWNVRGMNTDKLDIVKTEMKRPKIDILGISELHWAGSGYFNSDDYTVYYSGNESIRRNGVAFIANKKIATAVEGFSTINDRIISIRIDGRPRPLTILQVHALATDANQEDIEKFYANLQQAIDQAPAKNTIYITGDFNAKVGAGEDPAGHRQIWIRETE